MVDGQKFQRNECLSYILIPLIQAAASLNKIIPRLPAKEVLAKVFPMIKSKFLVEAGDL